MYCVVKKSVVSAFKPQFTYGQCFKCWSWTVNYTTAHVMTRYVVKGTQLHTFLTSQLYGRGQHCAPAALPMGNRHYYWVEVRLRLAAGLDTSGKPLPWTYRSSRVVLGSEWTLEMEASFHNYVSWFLDTWTVYPPQATSQLVSYMLHTLSSPDPVAHFYLLT